MTHRPEDAEPLLPEDRRRRRILLALLVLLACSVAVGVALALLTAPHHHASQADHDSTLADVLDAVAVLGMLVLCVPMIRSVRAVARVGTPQERGALAGLSPQRRAAMVSGARRGDVDAELPHLQRVLVRREYLRTRWGVPIGPLVAMLLVASAARSTSRLLQVAEGLVALLMLLLAPVAWRGVARLRNFLRDTGVPVDAGGHD